MRLQSILSLIVLITFFLSACIDEIDFEVPREYQNSTVIVGKLVKGDKPTVEVFIQKIFDFSFVEEKYLKAMTIYIVNEDGNKIEVPRKGLGKYELDLSLHPEFEVKVGKGYSLEVELFDGQKFRSSLETILPVPKIIEVEKELIQKEIINNRDQLVMRPKVNYYVSTPLYGDETKNPINIKWDIIRTHKQTDSRGKVCYIDSSPDFELIEYFDSKTFNRKSLNNHQLLQQGITSLMAEGQYISIIQESISDDGLEFFKQMKELSINSGTFYEPPAGKIISNFENLSEQEGSVFGYFYATNHDTMRTFVGPELIGNIGTICLNWEGVSGVCDQCCDCEKAENSTTTKPSFWIH